MFETNIAIINIVFVRKSCLHRRSISGSFTAKLLKSLFDIQFNGNFISAKISSIQFDGNLKFERLASSCCLITSTTITMYLRKVISDLSLSLSSSCCLLRSFSPITSCSSFRFSLCTWTIRIRIRIRIQGDKN